jgi:hypothetical protein
MTRSVVQAVEHLHNQHKALSSTPNTAKKKKKRSKMIEKELNHKNNSREKIVTDRNPTISIML